MKNSKKQKKNSHSIKMKITYNITKIHMDLQTVNELFITSKMNSFFGFRKTDKRKSLAEEIIELKNYTIIRLNLTHEEILRTKQEHATFKEVIESLLFLYGHLAERLYPNISLTPLVIN